MSDDRTRLPISQFADWLATKPRDETFDFFNISNCALAQFARHLHPEALHVGGGTTIAHAGGYHYGFDEVLDQAFSAINVSDRSDDDPRTFGELYDEVIKLV